MDVAVHFGKIGMLKNIPFGVTKMKSDLVDKQSIDDKIRICVSCGSIVVIIEGDTMSCKSCGKQFKFRGGINGFRL